MRIERLNNHKYAQCHVEITDSDNFTFVSYSTPVVIVENGYARCTGTYSQTTRRQITWFLREYIPHLNYYDMKESAECGNIFPI